MTDRLSHRASCALRSSKILSLVWTSQQCKTDLAFSHEYISTPPPPYASLATLPMQLGRSKGSTNRGKVSPCPPQGGSSLRGGRRLGSGKHLLSFSAGDDADEDGDAGLKLAPKMLPAHAFASKGSTGRATALAADLDADDAVALAATSLRRRTEAHPEETAAPSAPRAGAGGAEEESGDDAQARSGPPSAQLWRQKRARFAIAGLGSERPPLSLPSAQPMTTILSRTMLQPAVMLRLPIMCDYL